jgi:hypothetical protein
LTPADALKKGQLAKTLFGPAEQLAKPFRGELGFQVPVDVMAATGQDVRWHRIIDVIEQAQGRQGQ